MNIGMFIVGGIIFGIYMYFLIWNIFYSSKKQREENYPNLKDRSDLVDYDGMGNYGRFPTTKSSLEKPKRRKRKEPLSY